jgi:two-component system sensor kinase FixL
MGKRMQAVLPPEVGARFEQAIDAVNHGLAMVTIEYALEVSNEIQYYEARLVALPDRRITMQVRQITEAKKAQEQIGVLRDELAHLSRVGNLGEMASGLAHELNQPLAALHVYATAALELADRADWPKAIDCLQHISQQSLRAGQIVHRMRSFVRRGPSRRTAANVHQLIREVLALLDTDLRHNSVQVQLNLADHPPRIVVDGIQIQQVLVNLIRNAIEAMARQPEGSRRLSISTSFDDRTLGVRVTDSGAGIDPAVAANLFQPFQTTKPTGLGLGLAICRTLIEDHGGTIRLESVPSGGATFLFTLPLSAQEVHA